MTTINIALPQTKVGELRPLNIMRDLPKVADLVELCFQHNMDSEGKSYLRQMRRASQDSGYLSWASNSVPLKGYIWEDQKRIVGNISVVPFRKAKKNIILLANIAVHPDYRRRGIARLLTEKGVAQARQRRAKEIWLQVEESNRSAIKIYESLGFQARALRTTWNATSELKPEKRKIEITTRTARFWAEQYRWLTEKYPEEIRWYRMPDFQNFKPGLKYWFHKLFVEMDIRQWAVQKDGKFQAALIWTGNHARRTPIWLASVPQADTETLAALLLHARLHLAAQRRHLYIDYPAGEQVEAFKAAGFAPHRTLLWMRAEGVV